MSSSLLGFDDRFSGELYFRLGLRIQLLDATPNL